MNTKKEPFVITQPFFKVVKLVDKDKTYYNEIDTKKALQMAWSAGKDLVCFQEPEKDTLALCKIIDFSKWKYLQKKQEKKQKNHNKKETKEVRFSLLISDNDIRHKIKHAEEFLNKGNEVIFTMRLKGRERQHFPEALEKMNFIIAQCDHGQEVSKKTTSSMITIRLAQQK